MTRISYYKSLNPRALDKAILCTIDSQLLDNGINTLYLDHVDDGYLLSIDETPFKFFRDRMEAVEFMDTFLSDKNG